MVESIENEIIAEKKSWTTPKQDLYQIQTDLKEAIAKMNNIISKK